jgi:tetratricopeptide (TPR) repeat protein
MMRTTMCLLILAMALTAGSLAGQTTAPDVNAANELFAQSKWPEAAAAYRSIATADPANVLVWQNLGEALLQQHRAAQARDAFQHALDLHSRPVSNQVNIARPSADENDRANALALLQKLIASGYGGIIRPIVLSSIEFAQWKSDGPFQALLAQTVPCQSPGFHQFDFWIGDWEVQDPQGNVVGRNLVTREQDGCLLIEHWTASAGGQTGTSFNYYDVQDRLWHQLYIDNSGNAEAFPAMAGTLTNAKMVLRTDSAKPSISRWTWYTLAPNKVRQMAEQSTDNQKTWTITWDSVYVKKN